MPAQIKDVRGKSISINKTYIHDVHRKLGAVIAIDIDELVVCATVYLNNQQRAELMQALLLSLDDDE